jgi:2-haloacid dehalogenase
LTSSGPVVDWRSGVIRDGRKLGDERGIDVDWAAFADAWREQYQASLERVRAGEIPWRNLDTLHRNSLEELLDRFGVEGLTEAEKARFNRV